MENVNEPNMMDMATEPILMPGESVVCNRIYPVDIDAASIENGVLRMTTDIEQAIEETDRGEVVSMSEFRTIFAKWIG